MQRMNILIVGRSRPSLDVVQKLVSQHAGCRTEVRVITNGHTDPLHGVKKLPDLLLLQHAPGHGELDHLGTLPADQRPDVIVFGPADDAVGVRLAMRAGARDYLPEPINPSELDSILKAVTEEIAKRHLEDSGSLHVFINGKGGSGASFLAANVAHGLAFSEQRVILADLDLQFGGLCRYLDLKPAHGIFEAMQSVDELDEVAAEAFTCKHDSGLRFLAAKSEQLILNDSISPERLVAMLQVYRSFNDFVIVDLPRHIDLLAAAVLERADRIMVVTQQSLPHLHDTARLLTILKQELGIDEGRINVVVNRHDKSFEISIADIKKALHTNELLTMPNQFKLTTESINSGVPLTEVTRFGSVARGLRELHNHVGGVPVVEESIFSRALPGLLTPRRFKGKDNE